MNSIPVLRPRLPSAEALLPYLKRIDATRVYSNNGPLAEALEARLAEHLELGAGTVATASSGTAALTGAILGLAGRAEPARPLALIPAFTFIATATAVEQCGYVPYLIDIESEVWSIDPERLLKHPVIANAGLIVPVAPFGRPVYQEPWRVFRQRSGIAVVIDGAASFDTAGVKPKEHFGEIPVALSFHATKCFGTGEGGAVVTADTNLLEWIMRALNFGFSGSRDSRSANINGRMSEYHAAVGLAELDMWSAKLDDFRIVANSYRQHAERAGLAGRIHTHPDVSATYALYCCETDRTSNKIQAAFDAQDIGYRKWYGTGLRGHSYYKDIAHDSLAVTEDLGPRLLGLPCSVDLDESDIARVIDVIRSVEFDNR